MNASIPHRVLGKTGIEVSLLGIGGRIGALSDDQGTPNAAEQRAATEAIRRAVDLGVDYFDTAPCYGNGTSEGYLGGALRELSPDERTRLVLSTKVGSHLDHLNEYDADTIKWSLEQSLEKLGVEHIHVVYIHDPTDEEHIKLILSDRGAVSALEDFKRQGVIGAIGMGVGIHRFLLRFIDSGRGDVVLVPYDFNPIRDTGRKLISHAEAVGVGVVNASPYMAGLLAAPDARRMIKASTFPPANAKRAEQIHDWCRERGLETGTVAVQFAARHSGVANVLVGARTADEVSENVRHVTTEIPSEVWKDFEEFRATLEPPAPGGEAR